MERVWRGGRSFLQLGMDRDGVARHPALSCARGAGADVNVSSRERFLDGQSSRTPNGQGRRRECALGRRGAAYAAAIVEATGRFTPRDSVWSLDWNPGLRRTIAAKNRNRTGLWIPPH